MPGILLISHDDFCSPNRRILDIFLLLYQLRKDGFINALVGLFFPDSSCLDDAWCQPKL